MLEGHFADETIGPPGLLAVSLPPTLVAIVAFQML
jgi:hypothetical protein